MNSAKSFTTIHFAVKLFRPVGSCNTLNDLSNKVCIPNETEDLHLSVFNIVIGINESKTLTNHISFECKCKFHGRKCNSDQWWNNDKCRCECKKRHVCEKDYVSNPSKRNCKNGKYLPGVMDDSVIICDEVTESYEEETKTIPINFNEKEQPVKSKISMFYLHFY